MFTLLWHKPQGKDSMERILLPEVIVGGTTLTVIKEGKIPTHLKVVYIECLFQFVTKG